MQTSQRTGAENVAWDLSHLYAGQDDPRLSADLEACTRAAAEFAGRYRGRLSELDPSALANALREMEALSDKLQVAASFAYLDYSTNMVDHTRAATMQRIQEQATQIESELLFFRIEWLALDDAKAEALAGAEELAPYRHFLRATRRYKPHSLSESEEKILVEKSVTARFSWQRLFEELVAAIKVEFEEGEKPLEEALNELYSPQRARRAEASKAITAALLADLPTRTHIFNTVLNDKAIDDRLRAYPSWIGERNLANEASDESVQALIDTVVSNYGIVERYYRLKRRLLGYEELYDYDRYAPLQADELRVDWDQARSLVLEAYTGFSPKMADIARRFFDQRWIDGPIRPHKRTGAFAHPVSPTAHPYVMLNFVGRRNDVLTLAHELGHGVHMVLSSRQSLFNAETPLTLAETASVFGETVTFRHLLQVESDQAMRLPLLCNWIEDEFKTVFRQVSMNRFEDMIHTRRREGGELSQNDIDEAWYSTQQRMFGDSLRLSEGYRHWWSYVPHFIGVPGYVYAYAFGNLLALALYRRYQEQGAAFADVYLELLASGGSRSPEEIVGEAGVDMADPGFWQGGLSIIVENLSEAERLAEATG